jgi:hypothetical protein
MSDASSTSVTYHLTPDDLFAYHKDLLLRKPRGWAAIFAIYCFLLTFVLAIIPSSRANITTALVVAVIYVPLGWAYLRRYARRSYTTRRGMSDTWHIEIGPSGVSSSAQMGQGVLKWTAIERIDATREHIFFYLDKIRPVIIPRRAFASPATAEAFIEKAARWHAAATRGRR